MAVKETVSFPDREALLDSLGIRQSVPFTPENFEVGSYGVGATKSYRIVKWGDEGDGYWRVDFLEFPGVFKPELLVVAEGIARSIRVGPDSELTRIPPEVFARLRPQESLADDLAPAESDAKDIEEEPEPEPVGQEPPDLDEDDEEAAEDETEQPSYGDETPMLFDVRPELMGKATTQAQLWNIIFDAGCIMPEEDLIEAARLLDERLKDAKPTTIRTRVDKLATSMRVSPQRKPGTAGLGIFHVGPNWILSEDGVKPTSNARRAIASGAAPRGVKPPLPGKERKQAADKMKEQLEADEQTELELGDEAKEATTCDQSSGELIIPSDAGTQLLLMSIRDSAEMMRSVAESIVSSINEVLGSPKKGGGS